MSTYSNLRRLFTHSKLGPKASHYAGLVAVWSSWVHENCVCNSSNASLILQGVLCLHYASAIVIYAPSLPSMTPVPFRERTRFHSQHLHNKRRSIHFLPLAPLSHALKPRSYGHLCSQASSFLSSTRLSSLCLDISHWIHLKIFARCPHHM